MTFPYASLVGRFRLQVSDELLAFIERAFVEQAPDAERARVRSEAIAEARGAELEIQPDGTLISRSGAQEFYRIRLPLSGEDVEALEFEKAPGQSVKLVPRDPDTIVALQPGKPNATFVRRV